MAAMIRLACTCCLAAAVVPALAEDGAVVPPRVVFEDLGLAGFSARIGRRGPAGHLCHGPRDVAEVTPFAIAVRGPSGTAPTTANLPLAAEVRSRIERFDVAAGIRANPEVLREGPAHWTGRIGLTSEGVNGKTSLEVRTTLGRWESDGRLGVEVGPRIERRLRRGATFFIDGKAEAQAVRSQDGGWWALPGTTAADGAGMLGVMARTGLVR